jgi:hypothetical protein
MSGWNRLTNGLRSELIKLPVWTTEEDRRRALSYADRHVAEAREAIAAVHAGRKAPPNLGEIIAVAFYENAGWMPDGGFIRCRRQVAPGTSSWTVEALVQWLGCLESDLQRQLSDLESRLKIQCQEQDERVAVAQDIAHRVHQQLQAHHQQRILACLAVEDIDGAREIARRLPAGTVRGEIDSIITHEGNSKKVT